MVLSEKLYESGDMTVNMFDRLSGYDNDESCEIVEWIDMMQEDWHFTECMASYFFTEMLKYLGEDDEYKDEAELIAGLKRIAESKHPVTKEN
jgi:hypothetical protein